MRAAIQRHAQGTNIGNEDRPVFPSRKGLTCHVVDDNAQNNGDAHFDGEDEFRQHPPSQQIGVGQSLGCLEGVTGSLSERFSTSWRSSIPQCFLGFFTHIALATPRNVSG